MKNNLIQELGKELNYKTTENGGIAHKSTLSAVYDMFALGGAYRSRSDDDCILLFKNALEENAELALKCLFYLRDIRGGQGERRFFRVCFKWLAKEYPDLAFRNIDNVPEYGRWDDLYCLVGTDLANDAFDFMHAQLVRDIASLKTGDKEGVSLLGKWLKSENAHSPMTIALGNKTRQAFEMNHKQYRQVLSALRKRINIVERLMSEGRWDEIEYDKIPSRAGLIYKNTFAHRDAERYKAFIEDKDTTVHAAALYPYDIVERVVQDMSNYHINDKLDEVERETLNKYWANLPDYLNGQPCKTMCVIDTSGSMTLGSGVKPIDIAISLGMYCAERIGGPFKDYFISFSSRPQLIKIEGVDFCDKVYRIVNQSLYENTNLTAVFDLLLNLYKNGTVTADDLPEQLVVISDMEIDEGSCWRGASRRTTEMEAIREEWAEAGLKMPKLFYWNVDARHNTILDDPNNEDVTFVSGASAITFQSVLNGKSGIEVMLDKLNSDRYKDVK